ncbi:MAG: outer membrane protein assembly factor BamD [Rhodobacteraceae bacterium]|nr:MAG: outer membrane protein assembly factor BamD [Paracoccaceae bacterium]
MPRPLRPALRQGLALCALLIAAPLSAADLALVLANDNYRRLEDAPGAADLRPIATRLEDLGFEVISGFNADTDDLIAATERFRREAEEADRVLIVIDGHFVSSSTDAWFLARDAQDVEPLTLPSQGISLTSLAEIAGDAAAGRAVILAGRSSELNAAGRGLRTGTQGLNLPQGVTLASGTPEWLRHAIFAGLLREGKSLNQALSQLAARGFLSDSVGFTEGLITGVPSQPPVDTEAITRDALDEGFWTAIRAIDTVEALDLYLERYPRGRFADDARARIAALEADKTNRWEAEETALNLTRDERRAIQRDLTLLGFNTRGVDGIFGPGTRGAITTWQRDRRYEPTGFLNRPQWRQLTDEADRKREEQAEEARREEDRFWRQTDRDGTAEALRAYLERYPKGRHAEEARRRLAEFEAREEEENRRAARRAWQQAQEVDTLEAYTDFVARFPNSEYAEQARARIADLREDDTGRVMEAARAEENQNVTNPVTRLLVEQRLAQLGYNPGVPDGTFTEETREALRRFQRDLGIFESGYVTNRTVASLLRGR